MAGTWLSLVLGLRHGAHSLRFVGRRTALLHDRRPEIEAATETHAQDACRPSQRKSSQDSARSLNRRSRGTPCAAGRDATSESANRKGAARHLVYALSHHLNFGTSNSSSNATDNDLPFAERAQSRWSAAQRAIPLRRRASYRIGPGRGHRLTSRWLCTLLFTQFFLALTPRNRCHQTGAGIPIPLVVGTFIRLDKI